MNFIESIMREKNPRHFPTRNAQLLSVQIYPRRSAAWLPYGCEHSRWRRKTAHKPFEKRITSHCLFATKATTKIIRVIVNLKKIVLQSFSHINCEKILYLNDGFIDAAHHHQQLLLLKTSPVFITNKYVGSRHRSRTW